MPSLLECAHAEIYLCFNSYLGRGFTHPEHASDIPQFRIVDMFTSVINPSNKTEFFCLFTVPIKQFEDHCGHNCFGKGIDCADIRKIIYVGLPGDICSYIQENDRAGRNNQAFLVTLLQSRTYHPVGDDFQHCVAS